MRRSDPLELFLKGISEPFFDRSSEESSVVFGKVPGKVLAGGRLSGFGKAVHHAGEPCGRIYDKLTVFALETDRFELHPHAFR